MMYHNGVSKFSAVRSNGHTLFQFILSARFSLLYFLLLKYLHELYLQKPPSILNGMGVENCQLLQAFYGDEHLGFDIDIGQG